MKFRSVVILLLIVLSVVIIFYINRFLEKKIKPRSSFGRFFTYIISAFAIIFLYTFSLVWIIAHLFPVTK